MTHFIPPTSNYIYPQASVPLARAQILPCLSNVTPKKCDTMQGKLTKLPWSTADQVFLLADFVNVKPKTLWLIPSRKTEAEASLASQSISLCPYQLHARGSGKSSFMDLQFPCQGRLLNFIGCCPRILSAFIHGKCHRNSCTVSAR